MRRLSFAIVVLILASAGVPVAASASGAAIPVAPGEQAKVQPGGTVRIGDARCTLNFMFLGSDGNRYMGTAGHCVLGHSRTSDTGDAPQEETWAPGAGRVAEDGEGHRIGEFAYAILADPHDFSLIRLDPGVKASPQMAHFGGPTGLNDELSPDPVGIEFYGNGIAFGSAEPLSDTSTLPARSGFALGLPDPDHAYTNAPASPGDSGAGVDTSDGRALGVLVAGAAAFGGIGADGVDAGTVVVTRLAPQLALARKKTGVTFSLVTAPRLTEPMVGDTYRQHGHAYLIPRPGSRAPGPREVSDQFLS